ncbi:MAG: hypothetical protein N2657_06345 [bacterium]|nr:hypothetical protein [bacterium]
MTKALYYMIAAILIMSIAIAGIKKGDIQKKDRIEMNPPPRNVTIQEIYVQHNYGHYDTTVNSWSEEFKIGMRQTARNLIYNTSYGVQEILTAIGYNNPNFSVNYSNPSFREYFPGREAVGYIEATKELVGTYSTTIEEGEIQINIHGSISGRVRVRVEATHSISPLVLDLDGNRRIDTFDGKHIASPIFTREELKRRTWQVMDIDGDNVLDLVEKLGPKDGLLLRTDNPQTIVERGFISGQELFGQSNGYVNGFEKLKEMDLNNDRIISGEELNNLYVYQDLNNNGKIENNEIKSVQQLGITKIYTTYTPSYIGSFERNGRIYTMWDWYPNTLSVKFNNNK